MKVDEKVNINIPHGHLASVTQTITIRGEKLRFNWVWSDHLRYLEFYRTESFTENGKCYLYDFCYDPADASIINFVKKEVKTKHSFCPLINH